MSCGYVSCSVRCSVPNCEDKTSTRHRFPNPAKDKKRYDEWIRIIGNAKLVSLSPSRVYANYRVCHFHFAKTDGASNMYLKRTAVPSLNLKKVEPVDIAAIASKSEQELTPTIQDEPSSEVIISLQASSTPPLQDTELLSPTCQRSNTPPSQGTSQTLLKSLGVTYSATLTPKVKRLYRKEPVLAVPTSPMVPGSPTVPAPPPLSVSPPALPLSVGLLHKCMGPTLYKTVDRIQRSSGQSSDKIEITHHCDTENNIPIVVASTADVPSHARAAQTPKSKIPVTSTIKRKCRRRPVLVRMLTSSGLAEHYKTLIDRKMELVESLKVEHEKRMEILNIEKQIKEEQLRQLKSRKNTSSNEPNIPSTSEHNVIEDMCVDAVDMV